MIPIIDEDDNEIDFEIEDQPTNTFKIDMVTNTINGMTDEIEAMKQAIYLILNIERYDYLIYSWDYGIELKDLFGQPIPYVISELQRRITEALTQDERITSVDDFSFDIIKGIINISFTVATIFGNVETEKAVNL